MTRRAAPAAPTSDEGGGFVTPFPDVQENFTRDDMVEQRLTEAIDCLGEAIAASVSEVLRVPTPSG